MKKTGKQILMLSLALLSPVIFIVLIVSAFVLFANIKYWRIDRGILNEREIVSILSAKENPDIETNYIWVRLKLKDGSTVVLGDVDLERGEVVFSSLDKFNDSGILRNFYYNKSNEMFSMSGLNYYSIYNTKEQIYRGKNAQIKDKKINLKTLIDNLDDIKKFYANLPVADETFFNFVKSKEYEFAAKYMGYKNNTGEYEFYFLDAFGETQ